MYCWIAVLVTHESVYFLYFTSSVNKLHRGFSHSLPLSCMNATKLSKEKLPREFHKACLYPEDSAVNHLNVRYFCPANFMVPNTRELSKRRSLITLFSSVSIPCWRPFALLETVRRPPKKVHFLYKYKYIYNTFVRCCKSAEKVLDQAWSCAGYLSRQFKQMKRYQQWTVKLSVIIVKI